MSLRPLDKESRDRERTSERVVCEVKPERPLYNEDAKLADPQKSVS
jgi:hypothetical protein